MPRLTGAVLLFVKELPRCRSPDEVMNRLQAVVETTGLQVASIWQRTLDPLGRDYALNKNVFRPRNSPPGFHEQLLDLVRKLGPSILSRYALQHRRPFTHNEAARTLKPTGNDRWVFELYQRHGFADGLILPCGEWTVALLSHTTLRTTRAERTNLCFAALHAASRIAELIRRSRKRTTLALRQHSVLSALASGEDAHSASKRLRMTTSTFHTHVRRARSALGAVTTEQAIYRATGLGLLDLILVRLPMMI